MYRRLKKKVGQVYDPNIAQFVSIYSREKNVFGKIQPPVPKIEGYKIEKKNNISCQSSLLLNE